VREHNLVILYLDDSRTALDEVQSSLSELGYEVVTARSALEASRYVAKCDIAIIDYHMPDMNGSDAVAALRPLCGHPPPLFYLYTSDSGIASGFRKFGFDGAFTWKGNTDALVSQLGSAARILRMRRFMGSRRA